MVDLRIISLAFIFFLISVIYYLKIYFYLKKKKQKVLKSLTIKSLSPLPEIYRFNPLNWIPFLFNLKGEKDQKLRSYKLKYIIFFLIALLLLFLAASLAN